MIRNTTRLKLLTILRRQFVSSKIFAYEKILAGFSTGSSNILPSCAHFICPDVFFHCFDVFVEPFLLLFTVITKIVRKFVKMAN